MNQIYTDQKYKTLLVMVAGFLVLYLIFQWQPLIYLTAGITLLPLLFPPIGGLIVNGWLGLAHILGWINARILLSIIFYVFLLPLALIQRFTGRDPLQLKPKQNSSFFFTRDHEYTKKDLEKMW